MLAKKYCLKKDRDFRLTFKNGKTVSREFIFLKVSRNNLQASRFGFVVGKKISNKAVVRNKIKRQLREIVRKNLSDIKSGFDIIIGAKAEILEKSYQEMEKEVGGLLKKAGLL